MAYLMEILEGVWNILKHVFDMLRPKTLKPEPREENSSKEG